MPFPRDIERFHLALELPKTRPRGGSHQPPGGGAQASITAYPPTGSGEKDRAEYVGACRPHITQGAQRLGHST